MRDCQAIVRERLGALGLTAAESDDVAAELASHLEELCEERRSEGLTESAAVECALNKVTDWPSLARQIRIAKRKEGPVNDRTRKLWLPALASLTAANVFLMALTLESLQPSLIMERSKSFFPGAALMLEYWPWLASLPLWGALGAYLSHRVGGDHLTRLWAGVFPSVAMFGCLCFGESVSILVQRDMFVMHHAAYGALGVIAFALVPGVALLLGALPFVAAPNIQES